MYQDYIKNEKANNNHDLDSINAYEKGIKRIKSMEKQAQAYLEQEKKKAKLEVLKELKAFCQREIRNSDDWRIVASEIDKQIKELGD